MNIIRALSDRRLFGSLDTFADLTTWRPWLAFLRSLYGLPMDTTDLDLWRQQTGRETPRVGGYDEAVVIVGRQSGKTQVAALLGVFEATQALTAGASGVYVPLVAQDLRSAQRALFGYVKELVEGSDLLRDEVTRDTTTELELAGDVTLGVYPCRPAAVRGIRAAFAAVDELAYFTATDGRPQDQEMLRAIRPTLATTGGRLLVLSSPYAQVGALYDLHRRHYGRDDSPTLVWQASAPDMNPTLSADYLARMADDPDAFVSEVGGDFRAGISTFIDPAALDDVVAEGVRERQPVDGTNYVAFADAASGSGKDSFAVAVAHREGERAVLDLTRAWKPPFNPSGVIAEIGSILETWDVKVVEGDRYAPGFVSEGFRKHDLVYKTSSRTTSDTYLEALPLINSGAVVILDHPHLLRELRGLERRRGSSGRDRVDHRRGSHDDRAVAAAGALVAASKRPETKSATWRSGRRGPTEKATKKKRRRRRPTRSPMIVDKTRLIMTPDGPVRVGEYDRITKSGIREDHSHEHLGRRR